jgi:anti-sigma B factor antagonist
VRIAVHFKGDVPVVGLSGKFLAGGDGPFLRQKVRDLIDAGAKKLVIDFADVPYIDSTGLGFLAGTRVTAEGAGVRLVLASLNAHVRKILEEVKLAPFFTIVKDEDAALARLSEAVEPAEGSEAAAKKAPKGKKSPPAAPSSEVKPSNDPTP